MRGSTSGRLPQGSRAFSRRRGCRRRARTSAAGFTLIEVVVSAAILSVCLLGIISTFAASYRDVSFTGRSSRAVQLAQQRLEELKSGPFPPADGAQTVDQYRVTWTVSSVGFGAAADDLRRISVRVVWPQQARPGSYDLVGFVSKPF
ncbi:MAG: prepilin-type N-terminal cleavage/methylation domain-containing protein [Candidatus Methylomirabilales bacterium]